MATKSALFMVNKILQSMESDEVVSVVDTVESRILYDLIGEVYEDIIAHHDWHWLARNIQLTSSVSTARPTEFTVPSSVRQLMWVQYNKKDQKLYFPSDFLARSNSMNTANAEVTAVTDTTGLPYAVFNNRPPTCFFSPDDSRVIFDGFDSAVDTNNYMETSKCIAYVIADPVLAWPDVDDASADAHVPTLPSKFSNLFMAGSKSKAFLEMKQDGNPIAERTYQRGLNKFLKDESVIQQNSDWETRPNYGRK